MAKKLWDVWEQFWFHPSSPNRLGLFRVVFFFLVLVYLYNHGTLPSPAWSDVDLVFWMPIALFKMFHLPVFPASVLHILGGLLYISVGLSCIGLLTRISCKATFILSLYLMGLPFNFFGKTDHGECLMVILMGLLSFSRSGDGWSVDRWINKRFRNSSAQTPLPVSGEYTWPLQAGRLAYTLVFFAAGYSKLTTSGLEWIFSNNLANNLIVPYYVGDAVILSIGLDIAQIAWICWLIAAWTILIEIGAPLALVSARLRLILVPSLFFMQIGIGLLMDMLFYGVFICYIVWLPWEQLDRWIFPDKAVVLDKTKAII